ncbi:MAG: formylglycine-generating enzyme family protein [Cyanobacteria bacterium P01_A01_bin.37]
MPSTQEREPRITINKQPGQNQCFDEALDEAGHLRMMQIPEGTFLMGSPEDEPKRREREGPQHEVTVQRFFMGKYPVTQVQWRFVAGLEAVSRELESDPSHFKGDDRPVEQVNWHEAVECCERLAQHTGREYRLPTEAEWEYACRAGTTTPFHFGETISSELANYSGTIRYNDGPKGESRKKTTSVFLFEVANAFGLCDMHGNVWEWCQDHWHGSYQDAPDDGSAWLTDDEKARRILRGGSWYNNPENCRSAYRGDYDPDYRSLFIGFRVVCSAPRTLQTKTR